MLQTLRDNTKGVVAGILVGLLVIIFALSGAEALFTGGGTSNTVASVNSDDITEQEVVRQVNMQRQQILSQYGESVPDEFISDERLRPAAIESLIQRRVMVQKAKAGGMAVSEARVNNAIVSNQQFHNAEGEFDSNRYQQLLRSAGFTPASYKKALREEMLIQQLTSGIMGSGFVTQAELEQLVSISQQTRSFDYVTLPRKTVTDEVEISDEAVREYYENHQEAFTQEEQVAVDYIELSVDRLMEEIEIPEQELRAQYEQNQAQQDADVQHRVAHILVEEENASRIQEIQDRLEAGETFADLAEEYSDDSGTRSQGGDLGYVQPGTLPDAFENALAGLEVNQVSEPVQTEAGTHIIKLLDERRSEPETFEAQREEIADQLKRVEAESRFVDLMTRLEELSYNAQDLSNVAEQLGLSVENTGLFGRSGGEGVASRSKVIEAAFSDEVFEHNNSSELLELNPSHVVVIKKTESQDEYVKPLAEVKQQIVTQLENQEIRNRLLSKGEQAVAAVKEGTTLASLADQWGVEVHQSEDVSRDASEIPRELVSHVFSLPKPASNAPVIDGLLTQDGYTLTVVRDVEEGSIESLTEEERQSLVDNLTRMQGNQDYSAFQELLRANADIER